MKLYHGVYESPCGSLHLIATDTALTGLYFESALDTEENEIIINTKKQLDEYFKGIRKVFDLPLAYLHGTDFQKKAWNALLRIPYGETRSYQQMAQQIGHPKAVRALGGANHRNPISIIIPCHRVIGKNGSLTGYGGGMENKEFLLQLEKRYV